MRAYETMGRRGELGRLRQVARLALDRFGVRATRLTVLRHEHNTTFRVDAAGDRYVLRLNRSGVHDSATVASEMAWLSALAADTQLGVPAPVPSRDGSFVVTASVPGVPEPRLCVLLRWQDGRFMDRHLTPAHLHAVGELMAGLQEHALRWAPPSGFVRPRVDTLTDDAQLSSVRGPAVDADGAPHPTRADGRRACDLVERLFSRADAALISGGLRIVRATARELSRRPNGIGLLHADLHYENVLFRGGKALAIDFDDCGWGFHLYDLAVPLSELEDRPNYEALRDGLLAGYARHRPLPSGYEEHLRALAILRRMQLVLWIIESREKAAFRDDWFPWARKELARLGRAMAEFLTEDVT